MVEWIAGDFQKRGLPGSARSQAELLVSYALNISRMDIYLQFDKPTTSKEQKRLRELVKRRYQREPTAYILGNCEFWSLELLVGPGVLIPRQETEILVSSVLERISHPKSESRIRILELGTGSAAIPLAVCSDAADIDFYSVENSFAALDYAKKNITCHLKNLGDNNNRIYLIHADRFDCISTDTRFDFIVSNPPYIETETVKGLQQEVLNWEPSQALLGGENGLDYYDYFLNESLCFLKPGGYLIFEHGHNQKKSIQNLYSDSDELDFVESVKDYGGLDRVLIFQKK